MIGELVLEIPKTFSDLVVRYWSVEIDCDQFVPTYSRSTPLYIPAHVIELNFCYKQTLFLSILKLEASTGALFFFSTAFSFSFFLFSFFCMLEQMNFRTGIMIGSWFGLRI
jgi:hypothetical protein